MTDSTDTPELADRDIEQNAHAHDEPDSETPDVTHPDDVPPDEGDQAAHDDPDNPTA